MSYATSGPVRKNSSSEANDTKWHISKWCSYWQHGLRSHSHSL